MSHEYPNLGDRPPQIPAARRPQREVGIRELVRTEDRSSALQEWLNELTVTSALSRARIAAIEVKASSQVRPTDLRGLRLLRDCFPDRFVGGTVLYLGPLAYTAEDRIHVVPLDRLWM